MSERDALVAEAWRRGLLTFKMLPVQKSFNEKLLSIPTSLSRKFVVVGGRGTRKSSWLFIKACEAALREGTVDIPFIAPVERRLDDYISPIVKFVLADCPCPPRFTSDNTFHFDNGSRILLRGSNNKSYDDLRGGKFRLALVDEAAQIDSLVSLIDDVLMPGCIKDKGRLIMSSTPPVDPEHPFERIYCREAELGGWYHHASFIDAGYTEQEIIDAKREAGGEDGITWKREYLAIRGIVDDESRCFPDFSDANVGVVPRHPAYSYLYKMLVMDL